MSIFTRGAVLALSLLCLAAQAASARADDDLVAKGDYLTKAADCVVCHTAPGGKPFAGGRAFSLPIGTIYSPNITPDKTAGIGDWTDEEFVRALHEGIAKDGSHLYPAFPYTSYTLMPREDVLAIRAYLATLEPVSTRPPENEVSFPFNQRWLMWGWNLVFNSDSRFAPDPAKSAEWNRGAYLVQGPGHCGECHTPRNIAQARKSSMELGGAEIQGWQAYNITSDVKTGIGGWTEEDLAAYLKNGFAEGHGAAAGSMAEVVSYSLRYLTDADLKAIAIYLKSVPPVDSGTPAIPRAAPPSIYAAAAPANDEATGQRVFAQACAGCHAWSGQGLQTPYAALIGDRALSDPTGANIAGVLLCGSHLQSPDGPMFMPSFAKGYSDTELAAVANFAASRFGAGRTELTPEGLAERRKDGCEG
ncbi:Cytochrome c, mono- and diheme variants [Arboricoccus pini]|uniref:Cytochrome c, mono- and diheme variants n=1 Tax=Arboricoccus pini TaxID=1963835 RepID=A0A212S347_9PROT|nr:cytochrome c [Arboricoccus pini]SNB79418.1 Cytochrome c, mono- and diheme variants [Arboricoccus pini]